MPEYPYDVYEVETHDYDDETQCCKRCGLHELMIQERGLMCRFSLNMTAITHVRQQAINREKIQEKTKALNEYIDAMRRRMKEKHQRTIRAIEEVVEDIEHDEEAT